MTKLVDNKLKNYRAQNGTKEHPARSCREIQLDHPNVKSGMYNFLFVTRLVLLVFDCVLSYMYSTRDNTEMSIATAPRDLR